MFRGQYSSDLIRLNQSEASIQYSENFQRCINGENLWKSIQEERKGGKVRLG